MAGLRELGCALALGLAAGALALGGTAQAAEDWALAAQSAAGDNYEIDLGSLTRNGDVVQGWLRQRLAKPLRDRASGRSVTVTLSQTLYDCTNHRWANSGVSRFDREGRQIDAISSETWTSIAPGTVASALLRAACAVSAPIEGEPYLQDITAGQWVNVGLAADGKSRLWVKMDRIVKPDADHALFFSRADYLTPSWMDGLAVTHMVQATVIDCKAHTTAHLGSDAYIGAAGRVLAYRIDKEKFVFEPINPTSPLQNSYASICAGAVAPKGDEAQEGHGLSVGTAWGVTKGYLVTASHVIANGDEIEVLSDGEPIGKASVVVDDPVNDVAVLKLEPGVKRKILALPLSNRAATLGRPVFTLGYPAPDTLGAQIKMTAGQVSSVSGARDDARFLQISAPVQPGNSGGPLIGWDGSVLGVIESRLKALEGEDLPPENINYALKSAYVRPLLEGLPDLGNYVVLKPGLPQEALVGEARRAVFMLLVTPQQ